MKDNTIQVPIDIDERKEIKAACEKIQGITFMGFYGDDAIIRFEQPWNLFYLGQQFDVLLLRKSYEQSSNNS